MAVRADRRRLGHGSATLERIIRSGYDLGALGASEDGGHLHSARGWQLWRGPTAAVTLDGVRRTGGQIYVLPGVAPLDPVGELVCDWRPASIGDRWVSIWRLPVRRHLERPDTEKGHHHTEVS
ncbi:MAG TPA: hypothetical protein VFW65_18095 [Pseudonocardiaceae bacterium]|nr:hypothetical protein [Pseudonocardiaceae bacterium]